MKRFYILLIIVCLSVVSAVPIAVRAQENDRTLQLLRSLSEAPGPSGFEEPVRKIMVEQMKPFADRVSFDGLGSVIAQQGNSGPRIMVDAHMDELGGMIRRITPDGYLSDADARRLARPGTR